MRKTAINPILPAELPVFEYKGEPVADSRDVAAMIERPHKTLIRSISTFIEHLSRHKIVPADFFIPSVYLDEQGKVRPCYYLTEMGCDMGANKMTGEKGTVFTAKYVKAFHQMRSFIRELQSPIWRDTRSLGKEIRKRETDSIKALVDYAKGQGSQHAERYYKNLSNLADSVAGISDRDRATVVQLNTLLLLEGMIGEEIQKGISAGQPYKTVYQACKDRLSGFSALISPARLA